jgi:hypothetical protein
VRRAVGASSSRHDHVFIARQKHGFAACNEASAAREFVSARFLGTEEKKNDRIHKFGDAFC